MSKRQIIDTIKAQIDARQKLIDNRSKSNLDEEAIEIGRLQIVVEILEDKRLKFVKP